MPPRNKSNSPVELSPLNRNQALYISALKNYPQVVVIGSSGTGKTFIAATEASRMLRNKTIGKIILTRPIVSVGKDLGHFPGTLLEKVTPWAQPVLETLSKQLGKNEVAGYLRDGIIEIAPLSTMRGRSFDNCFLILDEAQNTTLAELKMFLTRIGENCKVVINGDIQQSDLKNNTSGLAKLLDILERYGMDTPVIEFTEDDIVRSDLCKQWIKAFNKYERDN